MLAVVCIGVMIPVSSQADIGGEGLTISPPLLEVTVQPNSRQEQLIKITNPTKGLIEVYPTVMNFTASGEGGEPAFTAPTDENKSFELAKWVSFSQQKIALFPEQVVEFKYYITTPEGAEPGGHYGVIFFSTKPPEADETAANRVALSSQIGALIMAKVPGAIVERGYLEKFSTSKIHIKTKINLIAKIINIGNIHFKPKGQITIKNILGNEVEKITVNKENGNILPNSTRHFDSDW